jgi:hypothetical protein
VSHRIVVPVVQRPDYWCGIEQWDNMSLAHCQVRRWTPAVARALAADIDAFMALHGGPLWSIDNDPKQVKFLKHFGFVATGDTALNAEGQPRALYRKN